MWINLSLYCQVVVSVISSRPRTIFLICLTKYRLSFSFHHFSAPSYCLLIASSAAGRARLVKCDLRRKRFRLAMYWLTGRVRCGQAGGAPRMAPNVSCGLEFTSSWLPGLHQPAHCPRTIRWFLIPFNWARRGLLARSATGLDPAQPADTLSNSVHPSAFACQYAVRTRAGITAGQCQPMEPRWKWIYLSFQRSIHQSTKMICWGFEYF